MRLVRLISSCFLLLFFTALSPDTAHAAPQTFNVTKLIDTFDGTCDADCSLREAIEAANTNGNPGEMDVINLPAGTYVLSLTGVDETSITFRNSAGDLDIGSLIEISGASAETTIIDADYLYRVIEIKAVGQAAGLNLSNVTIQKGDSGDEHGGGVYNVDGIVNITDSIFTNNIGWGSAALYNHQNVTMNITRTLITNNTSSRNPGAIQNWKGTMTITESVITENSAVEGAGVLNNQNGIMTIERSLITGNLASQNGGGVMNLNLGELTINNTTISGNRAGVNPVTGGYGGGINNTANGIMTITNSTITGNEAPIGTNGNPTGRGGGIRALSEVTVSNSIIAGNSGDTEIDCGGAELISNGHNLFGQNGNANGCPVGTDDILLAGEITTVFGALADNGGETQTHKLITGSPALDAGDCTAGVDQRGLTRPAGSACDIGALEIQVGESTGGGGGGGEVCPVTPGGKLLTKAPVRPQITFTRLVNDTAEWYNVVVWNATSSLLLMDEWYPTSQICNMLTCNVTPDSAALPAGFINGENQIWIRSWGNNAFSDWRQGESTSLNMALPDLPTAITATGNQGRPSIQIAEDNEAAWYQVWVGGNGYQHLGWYEKKLNQCCDGICTIHLDAYPPEGSYEVYAQAWGPGGYSSGGELNGWAGPKPLTIALTQPELVTPLTATLEVYQGTLNWQGTPGAEWYEVWVGSSDYTETNHFEWHSAADLHCRNATVCSLTLPLYAWDMTVGESYTWFVRAWGTEGFTTGGEYAGWSKGEDMIIPDPYASTGSFAAP